MSRHGRATRLLWLLRQGLALWTHGVVKASLDGGPTVPAEGLAVMGLKTPAAVLIGMAVAVGVLIAPGAAAEPSPGRAMTWGNNLAGQLGNNTTTDSAVPVTVDISGVLAGKTVTAIATGDYHSCAVADGKAYCWGGNAFGQLGNNTTTNSTEPVRGGYLGGTGRQNHHRHQHRGLPLVCGR